MTRIQFNRHWGSWSSGYLKLAEQGFIFLKNQPNIGRTRYFRETKAIYSLENGHLIIASIWNIKHGIELLLKGLEISFDNEYSLNHDLQSLLNKLDGKIGNFVIQKDLNALKKLIRKYYQCDFSSKTRFSDTTNTFFKYPEINISGCTENTYLNYSFVHDLTRRDINHFLKDIHALKEIYRKIESSVLNKNI